MIIKAGHLSLRDAVRYIIYGLLALNIFWFFRAEFAASGALLDSVTGWTAMVTVFSETLDTLAWVALFLLFEFEVRFLPAKKLHAGLRWLLSCLRFICYMAILFSIYGYWAMWHTVTTFTVLAVQDACALANQGYRYLAGLDLYPAITSSTCHDLLNQPLVLLSNTRIVATPALLETASQAALVDIVNAVTWLIVVIVMEAEIYLQQPESGGEQWRSYWLRGSKWVLLPLYAVLLGCAIYWLLYSEFLDFWDALLWLLAFALLELDILDWHTGTDDHALPSKLPAN